jgi:hypothetical protein
VSETVWYRKAVSFGRKVGEHVAVAERAIGRPLPKGAVVHHIDENKHNNAPRNLVICQDKAYHNLLHRRERALRECGDPDALRCQVCSGYDDQPDMRDYACGAQRFRIHGRCLSERNRANKQRRKAIRMAA